LKSKSIDEEVHEDDIAFAAGGIEVIGGEAVLADESGVKLNHHSRPSLADGVDFVLGANSGVCIRVNAHVGRVADATDTGGVVVHVRPEGEGRNGGAGLLGEEGHCVGPSLAHATSLSRPEARASSSTGHAVGDSVGEFVGNDIVLESTITVGGVECPGEHAALSGLAVRGSREVCVVGARRVLNREKDGIVALSTEATVVGLEVESLFCETVLVGKVLDVCCERGEKMATMKIRTCIILPVQNALVIAAPTLAATLGADAGAKVKSKLSRELVCLAVPGIVVRKLS
jgi:hypothetical protein